MTSPDWLSPEVVAAIESGMTIEAIKLLRESTGIGLTEAKEAVDAYARRRNLPAAASAPEPSQASDPSRDVPAGVMEALRNGNKIEAVRLVREKQGLSLRDAKLFVDLLEVDEQPAPSGNAAPIVPRKSSALMGFVVLLLIVAAYVAYRLLVGN